MSRKSSWLAAAGCALFAQGALADLPFKAGDREVTFSGTLSRSSLEIEGAGLTLVEDDATQLVVTGTYGYFLNENMMVGVTTGVRWLDSDSGGAESDALGGLNFDYHFPIEGSAIVPVVGVLGRTVLFDGLSDRTLGINGGVRLLMGRDISVNVRVFFERSEEEEDFGGINFTLTQDDVGVRTGFTWILR